MKTENTKSLKKSCLHLATAAVLAVSVGVAALLPSPLHASAAEKINMLSTQSDWVSAPNKGAISISDQTLSITPIGSCGTTYTPMTAAAAEITFDYQLTYAEGVDPYTEDMGDMLPYSFFGVLFMNTQDITGAFPPNNVFPWTGVGGYPYMLCFDTERQEREENRYDQVGLTLRKYKRNGGHDYDSRWSTVAPCEEEFVSSTGKPIYSKIPEFSKPVTVTDCFDTDKHSVKLAFDSLYKSQGDEYDAVDIQVWFDEELVLHVIDEMPFEGENWGAPIDVDKRGQNGYIQFYASHDDSAPNLDLYAWKVDITNLFIETKEGGPVNGGGGDTGGCGGVVAMNAALPLAGASMLCAGTAVIARKKQKSEKKGNK